MAVKFLGGAVDYLLGGPAVGGASEVRLQRWLALPAPQLALPHARARYVVVDREASRAGARGERLIAIGAAAVTRMELDLGGCFAAVLRQDRAGADADRPARGQGGQGQPAGIDSPRVMLDFLDYLGRAPLVAFDAAPTRRAVERAVKHILGVPLRRPWIDLAALLPTLFPNAGCATLGEWLGRCGLAAGARPGAIGDAFATAQLLQVALAEADRAGMICAAHLLERQAARDRPDAR